MASVFVRVYGPLNDFLPPARRQTTLACELAHATSVKDLLESVGVPHTEIDHLVVNSDPVGFAHLVRAGDRVAAFPAFQAVDVSPDARLGPPAAGVPRFVADVHLGRLAAYLRLAGIDVVNRNDATDPELAAISATEDRTLLTRDVGLLKHDKVRRGYFVRATQPSEQLVEILRQFDLADRAAPFSRCARCNGLLERVEKREIEADLPPRTRVHYDDFRRCTGCGRLYWAGSHHAHMRQFLDAAIRAAGSPDDVRPADHHSSG